MMEVSFSVIVMMSLANSRVGTSVKGRLLSDCKSVDDALWRCSSCFYAKRDWIFMLNRGQRFRLA